MPNGKWGKFARCKVNENCSLYGKNCINKSCSNIALALATICQNGECSTHRKRMRMRMRMGMRMGPARADNGSTDPIADGQWNRKGIWGYHYEVRVAPVWQCQTVA